MRYFSKKILDSKVLTSNFFALRKKARCNICAVVKADAYGHKIKSVVGVLKKCDFFAVQNVIEGVEVRKYNHCAKILVLGYCSDYFLATSNNLSIMVDNLTQLKKISNLGTVVKIHLKINSGMNRLGFKNINIFKKALKIIKNNNKIIFEGIFTHFFCPKNKEITQNQIKIFKKYINICKMFNFDPIVHIGGSKMIDYVFKGVSYVRCGLALYGYGCNITKPVMRITSPLLKITKVKKDECVGYDCAFVASKDMTVGLVPFGYADGIKITQKSVTFANTKLNIVGKICMDMFMVDLTNVKAKVGDYVTVFDNATSWSKNTFESEYQILTNLIKSRTQNIVV